jgi:putative transposase
MARPQRIDIPQVLTTLLPRSIIDQLADEAELVQRQRKFHVQAFFWTLVLGFGTGTHRTLAALRRAYQAATGQTIVPSAFYDHFTPALVRFLKAAALRTLLQVAEPIRPLGGKLSSFSDLVVTDSTVIRLHDLLEGTYPACRTNHTRAALKMHTVLSVLGQGPRSLRITSERVHDGPVFRVGPWVKGRLLLFDLGYFRYQLMSCINRNGGFFIVRLKNNANPLIVEVNQTWRGRSIELVGQHIQDVRERLQRQTLDVQVQVSFKHRVYAGVRHKGSAVFRLVGVRDAHTGDYHLYLTNIPPERLDAQDIAQTYAARWLIELFFRELKSHYRAEDMPSGKREVVEALLYAVLLTVIVSRTLLEAVRRKLGDKARRVPVERWAAVFAAVARDLLMLLVGPLTERALERLVLQEAIDPNASRLLLLERVESGTQLQYRLSVGSQRT